MPFVSKGNVTGFHYTKTNCEKIIRDYFSSNGIEIDKYDMPFKLAKYMAYHIRQIPLKEAHFNKTIAFYSKDDVSKLLSSGYITIKEEVK